MTTGPQWQDSTARPAEGQTSGVWRLLSHGQRTSGDSPSSHATLRQSHMQTWWGLLLHQDVSNAYSQIKLAPESQKRLALSTHRGVQLQTQLPFGRSSAPGYFQEIMEKLTSDLKGVAVYIDDILVSGTSEEDHLQNLKALLQCLQDKGLRCCQQKCFFAEQSVEYLGYIQRRYYQGTQG